MTILPQPLRLLPWRMILSLLFIALMGCATLYSAAQGSMTPWAANHAVRFAAMFLLMMALSFVPMARWLKIAFPFYAISISLLLVVELAGQIGMGAQRWIDLGIVRIQPSEFMKLAVVLALARLYHRAPTLFINSPAMLLVPIGLILAPAGLVMLQPDLGTALMIIMAGTAIMFVAGIQLRWFLGSGPIDLR